MRHRDTLRTLMLLRTAVLLDVLRNIKLQLLQNTADAATWNSK